MNRPYYLSGTGEQIFISSDFVYYVEIHKFTKNGYNLESCTHLSVKDNRNIKLRTVTKLNDGAQIVKTLELVSAPEEFLIQNNYIKHED